jgi:hypothetical protein
MATSRKSVSQLRRRQLTLSLAERPVRISASQALEQEWLDRVVNSRLNSLDLLTECGPVGWFGRTSPASCRLTVDGHLESSSGRWGNAAMGSLTGFLTLDISECHSDAVESSLSDILETGDLPQRYFLSARACRGILRRAKRRGKSLPPSLRATLEAAAAPTLTFTGD